MHAQVQGALLVRRVWAAMLLPGIAKLMVRKNLAGELAFWRDLFGCLTMTLASCLMVQHSWLSSAVRQGGQDHPSLILGALDQGVREALQCSLTGQHGLKQTVRQSVGVLTGLFLGTCDIQNCACTGKSRGNSCESKECGTPPQWVL